MAASIAPQVVPNVTQARTSDDIMWSLHNQWDQEALDSGMTRAEIDDGEMVSYLWEYIHKDTGIPADQAVAEMNAASWDQIREWQKKHMPDWKPRLERGTLGYIRGKSS